MSNEQTKFEVVTVTLNPAIDRTIRVSNFTAGAVNRVEKVRAEPGGKGVNVAAALADYGHRVAVTGFLGRDNVAPFESLFARKRIGDLFVRIAGKTRVGIKIFDPVLKQTTDINFAGAAPAVEDLELLRQQLAAIQSEWFVVSGSIPPGVPATIYRDIVTELKTRGSKVLLDTSQEALRYAVEAKPDIIKPNIHELEALVGNTLGTVTAVIEAAQKLVAKGVRLVAISMGKDGACFVSAREVVLARPPATEVKSTVGAGDAMVAGIISAELQKLTLPETARHATAFSLAALTRKGASVVTPEAIQDWKRQVTVEEPVLPSSRQQAKQKSSKGKVTLASARKDFRRARQRAALEQIIAKLTGRSAELFSYQDVRKKLKAVETTSYDERDVLLDAIVGSNMQYEDFTRSFLPRRDSDEEIWSMVGVVASGAKSPPPVELYQVGKAYFVKDGHYRVSVARQRGDKAIHARVTEVRSRVPLSPDVQPAHIIMKAEQAEFLTQTNLSESRPGADLTCTSPECYSELAEHIDVHRYFMGLDEEREIPYEEAAAHWYDEVYAPVVEAIRAQKVLKDFPGRTETDLYIWIAKHRAELEAA